MKKYIRKTVDYPTDIKVEYLDKETRKRSAEEMAMGLFGMTLDELCHDIIENADGRWDGVLVPTAVAPMG